MVDFTRREVGELIRLGCTYIQIDAPQYAALLDPTLREGYRQRGSDPDRLIDACIEMDNAVIDGHPGVTFGLHICRGNNQSLFYASGGYEPIARVFSRSHFQRFLLEYDDARSGGFEPLRAMPDDRVVVLGLVTTKKPRLESVDELRRRIDEAATVRAPGAPGPEPAVRLRLDHGGQPHHPRRAAAQAPARGRDGAAWSGAREHAFTRRRSMGSMRSMRWLALFVPVFLGVWALAEAQAIKIGAVVPLTGRYGAAGRAQVRAGYEIAVEQLNAAGGITVGGKKMPLELVLLDDESDATKTVSRLETLAAQGVVAYLGGFGSDLHAAAASVAEKNRIPYLGVAFALHKVHQQGFRYLFSPFWKSPDIGQQPPRRLLARSRRPSASRAWRSSRRRRIGGARWRRRGRRRARRPATRWWCKGEYAPGRQGLLRPDPQGQGGQRRRRLRAADAARRHDHDQADEGAGLHAQADAA